jgi:hypothetical protein
MKQMASTNYFKPNWQAINKAIGDSELRKEMRKQLREITKNIDLKENKQYIQEKKQKLQESINELKKLSVGCIVYYTGRSTDIPFAATGTKVKDGRTRMVVEFEGKQWSCYYTNLSPFEPTKEQKSSRDVETDLTYFLNK